MSTPPAYPVFPDLAGTRLLLVTPHPDDESLALGGLIQQAGRAHAGVTLLQITDGDNNPWPQRWLEKHWHIGAPERAAWGARRVGEVRAAMAQLGLSATALMRLGWPDMGVTAHLRDAGMAAVDRVAQVMLETRPETVVLPDLGDGHPDHSSAHVVARLALARAGLTPRGLTYLVHGQSASTSARCVLPLDTGMREHKRRAVLAHVSQVALARRRLLAMVGPQEVFHGVSLAAPAGLPTRRVLPWQPPRAVWPWLRLTLAHPDGVVAWPWREAPLKRRAGGWELTLPSTVWRGPAFARLELRCTSPWIFDHWGWCDLTAAGASVQADD